MTGSTASFPQSRCFECTRPRRHYIPFWTVNKNVKEIMNKMVPYRSSGGIQVSLKFTLYTHSSLTLLVSGEDVGVKNVFSNRNRSWDFLKLGLRHISCMEPFKILLKFFFFYVLKPVPIYFTVRCLGDSAATLFHVPGVFSPDFPSAWGWVDND